jgi:hypothetical protein
MGGSILKNTNLETYICSTFEQYKNKIISLSKIGKNLQRMEVDGSNSLSKSLNRELKTFIDSGQK